MTQITVTPFAQRAMTAQIKVRLELEGVPDTQATQTITVRPNTMTITYHWDATNSRWEGGHVEIYGRRVLKSGELSDSTHQVFNSDRKPWVKHAITAYTPKNTLEIETEPMRHWSA